MKRSGFLLALCATLFSSVTWAQEASNTADLVERDAINYGNHKQVGRIIPFVSLGSFEFTGNSSGSNAKPTQRFGLGVLTTVLSGSFVLESGLSYLPVGTRYEMKEASGLRRTAMVDLDYLAVPIIVKKYVNPANRGIYFKAAVTPAYLLNSNSEVDAAKAGLVSEGSNAIEDRLKKTDVQGALGFGGLFATDFTSQVMIDLTWSRSLVPISKAGSADVYNEGFLLSAGLSL